MTPSSAWLITGCSSGFGLALASAVLARGQRVIATARQPSTLGDLAARFPETCRALELDVTDSSQVRVVECRNGMNCSSASATSAPCSRN